MIDIYCERTTADFWSEPLNAFTNLLFLVAAWFVWRLARKEKQLTASTFSLIGLMATIGIGSFLFHTFATPWAEASDVLPIKLFQLCFMWFYARKILAFNSLQIVGLFLAFFGMSYIGGQFPELLNGSLMYASAIVVAIFFGVLHFKLNKREPYLLLAASLVFIVGITLRSIDMTLCQQIPLGTHFLWHCCMSVLLYLLLRAYVLNLRSNRLP